jgi:thiamine biosynthesis protein ThiS
MPLKVILNGKERVFESLSGETTLKNLIQELGLKGDRVAVEHQGDIAPRASWGEATVHDGDKIEVVHFVGGGSSS